MTKRQMLISGLILVAGVLLTRNLYKMFLEFPDEANQGAIWRIFYFHLPAALSAFFGFYVGAGASIAYLVKKDLKWDALAAVVNESSLMFALITQFTGMLWAKIIWGTWWTPDPRLISYLICIILYTAYLMLRRAVDEPATRARLSAVLSLFAAAEVIIVWKSIEWWRTNHPGPVLSIREGGGMAPGWESLAWVNTLAIALFTTAIILVRLRQEQVHNEIDALRRRAHALI
jgi:heme exporter protein C